MLNTEVSAHTNEFCDDTLFHGKGSKYNACNPATNTKLKMLFKHHNMGACKNPRHLS